MNRIVLRNFRIIDADTDIRGSVLVEDGLIREVTPDPRSGDLDGDMVIDGRGKVLMPAFIDLHAHFRDPGFPEKETLESASLAAVAGGFGTVVCMANTRPVIDTLEKALSLKKRSDALGFIDLYPVLSLTKNMEGRELSGIKDLPPARGADFTREADPIRPLPLLLSEDGKDVADDGLFLAAMAEARRLGIPVSCHCDYGGEEALAAQKAGRPRSEWSRIEENNAVKRAIELGKQAGCHIHIAHVSTTEAAEFIALAKKDPPSPSGFSLSCEATPHHIASDEGDARLMGEETFGRVNPPLRTKEDRAALLEALGAGVIDAIATDHAPHSEGDKAAGAPGFTALETAFAVCFTALAANTGLPRLSALMSANPARILALHKDRGKIAPGLRADLVVADTDAEWEAIPECFVSRGKCTPFAGRKLRGKILLTMRGGRIVFQEKGFKND